MNVDPTRSKGRLRDLAISREEAVQGARFNIEPLKRPLSLDNASEDEIPVVFEHKDGPQLHIVADFRDP